MEDALDKRTMADFGIELLSRLPTDIVKRLAEYAWEDWGGEIRFMVAMLGLLNTRNVAQSEYVDKMAHNVKRIKQKKPPLFSHTILKIRPQLLNRYSGDGGSGVHRDLKLHFVRGHFKQRKTGLFYWSWHARGSEKHGVIEKDYEVER